MNPTTLTTRRILDTANGNFLEYDGLTTDPLPTGSLILNPQTNTLYGKHHRLGELPPGLLVNIPRTTWYERLEIIGWMMTDEGCKPIYRRSDETTRARTPDAVAPAPRRPRVRRSRRVPDSKPGTGDNAQ